MSEGNPPASTTTAAPPVPRRLADASSYEVDPGKGWNLFAGIMLAIVGVLNLVAGIAAVDNSQVYVRDVEFVFADLKTFGWLLIVVGAAQVLTAIGVFMANEAARWAGIAFASVNMILQFTVPDGASGLDDPHVLRGHHHHLRPGHLRRPRTSLTGLTPRRAGPSPGRHVDPVHHSVTDAGRERRVAQPVVVEVDGRARDGRRSRDPDAGHVGFARDEALDHGWRADGRGPARWIAGGRARAGLARGDRGRRVARRAELEAAYPGVTVAAAAVPAEGAVLAVKPGIVVRAAVAAAKRGRQAAAVGRRRRHDGARSRKR